MLPPLAELDAEEMWMVNENRSWKWHCNDSIVRLASGSYVHRFRLHFLNQRFLMLQWSHARFATILAVLLKCKTKDKASGKRKKPTGMASGADAQLLPVRFPFFYFCDGPWTLNEQSALVIFVIQDRMKMFRQMSVVAYCSQHLVRSERDETACNEPSNDLIRRKEKVGACKYSNFESSSDRQILRFNFRIPGIRISE